MNMKIHPSEVTVFVIECGELSLRDCMQHIAEQTVQGFEVKHISNVAPMWRAFEQMHERCDTRYFIQVDVDMLLRPHAVETLIEGLSASPKNTALFVGWLYERDMRIPATGVKIYDLKVFQEFPYRDSLSCEMTQIDQIKRLGFGVEVDTYPKTQDPSDPRILGEHFPCQTEQMAFRRWERNLMKARHMGYDYFEKYPKALLQEYIETGDRMKLFAFLGAISGATTSLSQFKETDFKKENEAFTYAQKLFQT